MTMLSGSEGARSRLIEDNEIPSLPANWDVQRFRFLFRESKERNGEVPVGSMLSVSEYRGVVPKEYEYEEQQRADEELQTYRVVRPGQMAVNTMWLNHLGLGVSDYLGHVSPAYAVYDISPELNSRFVHHLFRSQYYLKIYLRYLYGIRPNSFQIKSDDWNSIPVIVPPRDTQKAIAGFLDRETARIDQLIDKKHRLVGILREKARRSVSSTFEKLSLEHKAWRLKHVLISSLAYGANEAADGDDPDDVRYIRITDIDADGNLRDDTFKSLPYERARNYLLEDGDILLARSGGTVGKTFIYRKKMGNCCYAGYLIRARLNIKRISPDFFYQFTSTDQYWNHISETNIKATIQNVSAEKYANLAIPLPPRDQQDALTNEITKRNVKISSVISKVNTSINRLHELRSALITAAVTGQIDVESWDRRGQNDRALDRLEDDAAFREARS